MTAEMQSTQLPFVIAALKELSEDTSVPKNVRNCIGQTLKLLDEPAEISIKISRALHVLEGVADDANMQSYTRSQLLNIVSMLEVV